MLEATLGSGRCIAHSRLALPHGPAALATSLPCRCAPLALSMWRRESVGFDEGRRKGRGAEKLGAEWRVVGKPAGRGWWVRLVFIFSRFTLHPALHLVECHGRTASTYIYMSDCEWGLSISYRIEDRKSGAYGDC